MGRQRLRVSTGWRRRKRRSVELVALGRRFTWETTTVGGICVWGYFWCSEWLIAVSVGAASVPKSSCIETSVSLWFSDLDLNEEQTSWPINVVHSKCVVLDESHIILDREWSTIYTIYRHTIYIHKKLPQPNYLQEYNISNTHALIYAVHRTSNWQIRIWNALSRASASRTPRHWPNSAACQPLRVWVKQWRCDLTMPWYSH